MRPLIIDDNLKARVATILYYASLPAHRYRPHDPHCAKPGVGDNPVHCLTTQFGFRIVFSLTEMPDGLVYRHLSVSVPTANFPNLIVVWTLAELFGFTGWLKGAEPAPDWQAKINHAEGCIAVVQELEAWACPSCHRLSHNANDKANRYCGACKQFAPALPPASADE